FTFLDIGPAIFGGLLLAVTGGIAWYWKTHNENLEAKLLRKLIDESNQAQDQHLVERARNLAGEGHHNYASTLGSFVERKKQVEEAIHAEFRKRPESGVPDSVQEIEKLIDTLVFGVADQLDRLGEIDLKLHKPKFPLSDSQREHLSAARSDISDRVHEAWETLEDTWENLGSLIDPTIGLAAEDSSHATLDQAIVRLRHEQELAGRVQERMANEWADAFGDPLLNRDEPPLESE
ncbi:MAG: hypothetical protein AAF236_17155, partial [Verrucomicrobiota bacterium]